MPISQAHQDFLEEQMEACLNSESGVYLIECALSKAKFLANIIRRLTRKSIYDSFSIYSPDEALYGRSVYQRLLTKPTEHGLYLIRAPEPHLDPMMQLLTAAATGKEHRIHPANKTLLLRYQRYRSRLMDEPLLPERIRKAVSLTAVTLADDTLSIDPASLGYEIREIPREELLALIRSATEAEEPENKSNQPLDTNNDMP
jgi:hypothetical protein